MAASAAVANTAVMARQYQRPARTCRGLPLRDSAATAPVMTAVRPARTWTARTARKAGAAEPTSSPRMRPAVTNGAHLSGTLILYVVTLHIGIRIAGVLP